MKESPKAKVAVYVGTAWDPQEGTETPWIDLARQLAGEEGVKALGPRAKDDPPGGDTLNRLFEMAGGRVLLLFDEVLNGFSRHKWLAEALLNESVGAGYIDRNWPPAFKDTGAWPLASLRQSFLNGALTRLLDPDTVLRGKIVEFVGRDDFGLASGPKSDGTYERRWFCEPIPSDEVAFEPGVVLLKKDKAEALKKPPLVPTPGGETPEPEIPGPEPGPGPGPGPTPPAPTATIVRVSGSVPPELWNRLGTRVLPKLRSGGGLKIGVSFEVSVNSASAADLRAELRQILGDLGLEGGVTVE